MRWGANWQKGQVMGTTSGQWKTFWHTAMTNVSIDMLGLESQMAQQRRTHQLVPMNGVLHDAFEGKVRDAYSILATQTVANPEAEQGMTWVVIYPVDIKPSM